MRIQRPTIADVAREAGVSQQTVSRALNNKGEISAETRERVLAVVRRLGYRPSGIARGLVTKRTMSIGLVVPDIANPFFSEVARGAEDVAREAGYSLLIGSAIEDSTREERIVSDLEAQGVDGIILCSSRQSDDRLLALAERCPAVVLVNRCLPSSAARTVRVDDQVGASVAVGYLVSRGRRVIGLLAGPEISGSAQARAAAYRRVLSEAGLVISPDLVVPCSPYLDDGRAATGRLLRQRPDVDALYCYNDLVAVGALQACAIAGRAVPGEIAVVGNDDITLAALVTPSLTTVRSGKRNLGASAVHSLLDRLAGSDGNADVVLEPELVIRQSA